MARHRRVVHFVIAATALAFVVHTQPTTDADYRIGDSGRADAMTSAAHLTHGQVESILVTSTGGGALDRHEADQVARRLKAQASDVPGVTRVAHRRSTPTEPRCWSTSTSATPWTT